jgi:hypothetical protein
MRNEKVEEKEMRREKEREKEDMTTDGFVTTTNVIRLHPTIPPSCNSGSLALIPPSFHPIMPSCPHASSKNSHHRFFAISTPVAACPTGSADQSN